MGEEFGRVIGEVDFASEDFIKFNEKVYLVLKKISQ